MSSTTMSTTSTHTYTPEELNELLMKVLTIPEARCIRNALRLVLNRHPILDCFYNASLNEEARKEAMYNTFLDISVRFSFKGNKQCMEYYTNEYCLNTRGKNKGQVNNKHLLLLEHVVNAWFALTGGAFRPNIIRVGMNEYVRRNMLYYKGKPKREWYRANNWDVEHFAPNNNYLLN